MQAVIKRSILYTVVFVVLLTVINIVSGMVMTYFYQPEGGTTLYLPEGSNVIEFGKVKPLYIQVTIIALIFFVVLTTQIYRNKSGGNYTRFF